MAATAILGFIDGLATPDSPGVLMLASIVIWIWIFWGASVNRLHDIGQTGWLSLLYFVPFVNLGMLIWLGTQNSQPEANRWGTQVA
jgi:uncharacterized membrane protein YhaH (DUF805 family)